MEINSEGMGMTKYYVDINGDYIGAFDGATPPDGSIEVPEPPKDARQVWSNNTWQPLSADILGAERITEIDARLDEIDMLSVRSLRAKGNGRDNQDDRDRLIALDDEAVVLRTERDTLS